MTGMGTSRTAVRTRARHRRILTRPAIGAEPILGKSDRLDEIIYRLELERGQIKFFADVVNHPRIGRAIRIDVFRDIRALAFMAADGRIRSWSARS